MLLGSVLACGVRGTPKDTSLQELRKEGDRLRNAISRKRNIIAGWYWLQSESTEDLEYRFGFTIPPYSSERTPSDILREQRVIIDNTVGGKATLSGAQAEAFSTWCRAQRYAASLLARENNRALEGTAEQSDPTALLDGQAKDISIMLAAAGELERELARIESEIRRRAPDTSDGSDAAKPSEADTGEKE
jgi:hypothetical protein